MEKMSIVNYLNIKDEKGEVYPIEEMYRRLMRLYLYDTGNNNGEEDIFDLNDLDSFYSFAAMYGLDFAIECREDYRYWLAGTNYAKDEAERKAKGLCEVVREFIFSDTDFDVLMNKIQVSVDSLLETSNFDIAAANAHFEGLIDIWGYLFGSGKVERAFEKAKKNNDLGTMSFLFNGVYRYALGDK